MIKIILLTFIVGLTTAQYGHGGSGYGPDGVRNRYFILGHGRPVTGSVGLGIYGPSSSQNNYLPVPRYRPAAQVYSVPLRRPVSNAPTAVLGSYGLDQSTGYAAGPSSYGRYGTGHGSLAPHQAISHGLYGSGLSHGYSAPVKYDDLAQPTPYDFGYNVHNEHGDQLSRQESSDGHGNVKGSYGYRDSYGIFRHVDYVADHAGFRANVKTNEPGTSPQDPANVHFEVEHGGYGY